MKIEDIKVGMKVKLLGKHVLGDNYNNIENFYKDKSCYEEIKRMKEQGYGIVNEVNVENRWVLVSDKLKNDYLWYFLPSDIELYEEVNITQDKKSETPKEDVVSKGTQIKESLVIQPNQEKTPKEWLMTPLAISSTRGEEEYVTLGDRCLHDIADGEVFANIDFDYDDNLNDICNDSTYCDIIKITYKDTVVWQRKEEYFTLVEAIQLNKQIKHKDWEYFHEVSSALKELSDIVDDDFILKALSEKVWEVR